MGVRGLKEHEEVARGSEATLPQGLVTSPVFNPGPSCVCAEGISAPPPPKVTPRPLPRVMVQDEPLHNRAAMQLVQMASSIESPVPPPHESCWEEHIVFSWLVWLLSIFKELASTPTFPCFYGKRDSSEPARASCWRLQRGVWNPGGLGPAGMGRVGPCAWGLVPPPHACPNSEEPASGSFASSLCADHYGLTDKDAFRRDLEKTSGLCPVLWAHSGQPPCRASSWHHTRLGPSLCSCGVTLIASVWGVYPGQGGEEDPPPHSLLQVGEEPPALSRYSDMETLDTVRLLNLLPPCHFQWWE